MKPSASVRYSHGYAVLHGSWGGLVEVNIISLSGWRWSAKYAMDSCSGFGSRVGCI